MRTLLLTGVIAMAAVYNCKPVSAQELVPDSLVKLQPVSGKVWKALKTPLKLSLMGLFTATNNGILTKYDVREERNEHLANFHCNADDYLQYAPIVAVYGLNLAGIKGKHNLKDLTLILAKTELLVGTLSLTFKETVHVPRPDTGAGNSFPSGHTAQSFAVATIMAREYGKENVWYSISAYTMASSVGVMRVLNNRHWISDVLVGAGVGILSANVVYLTHKGNLFEGRRKRKSNNFTLLPTYNGGGGIYLSYKL